MAKLTIELKSPKDPQDLLNLDFQVFESSIAQKWLQLLAQTISLTEGPIHRNRFYNFQQSLDRKKIVAEEINSLIEVINGHYPNLINHYAQEEMTFAKLHELHQYFEKYHGPVDNLAKEYIEAPLAIKRALNNFNVAIHRYENLLQDQENQTYPYFIVDYENPSGLPLEREDFTEFTLKKEFGFLYIDYCEVGRNFWEMVLVDDHKIEAEKIQPQRHLTANFMAWFSDSYSPEKTQRNYVRAQEWFKKNEAALSALGYHWEQADLALGLIPVGKLINEEDNTNIREAISRYQEVSAVHLWPK